jgi:hypothetical protein
VKGTDAIESRPGFSALLDRIDLHLIIDLGEVVAVGGQHAGVVGLESYAFYIETIVIDYVANGYWL